VTDHGQRDRRPTGYPIAVACDRSFLDNSAVSESVARAVASATATTHGDGSDRPSAPLERDGDRVERPTEPIRTTPGSPDTGLGCAILTSVKLIDEK
jgi:hypothetical protein